MGSLWATTVMNGFARATAAGIAIVIPRLAWAPAVMSAGIATPAAPAAAVAGHSSRDRSASSSPTSFTSPLSLCLRVRNNVLDRKLI